MTRETFSDIIALHDAYPDVEVGDDGGATAHVGKGWRKHFERQPGSTRMVHVGTSRVGQPAPRELKQPPKGIEKGGA